MCGLRSKPPQVIEVTDVKEPGFTRFISSRPAPYPTTLLHVTISSRSLHHAAGKAKAWTFERLNLKAALKTPTAAGLTHTKHAQANQVVGRGPGEYCQSYADSC